MQIEYTNKDYDTLIVALKEKITYYLSEWTDHNETDFGIALLELLCATADVLHYYLNKTANEAFFPTVTQRTNLINLLKLIDYNMSSATPATTTLRFELAEIKAGDVIIPLGTECQSVTDETLGYVIYFETDSSLTLPIGVADSYEANQLKDSLASFHSGMVGWTVKNIETDLSAVVTVFVSSAQLTFSFDLFPVGNEKYGFIIGDVDATEGQSGSESLGVSDGSAYQQYIVAGTPIIDGTLIVKVDGTTWIQKNSLAASGPADQHYYVQRDADDQITVFFGDDSNGKIPPNTQSVTSEFRAGGGIRGNIAADTIQIINDDILYGGSPVSASVTNPAATIGGTDRETMEYAKLHAPETLKTLGRAVTEGDYKELSEAFSGVARASIVPNEIFQYKLIDLYIIPDGGGLPSQALKDNLLAYLDDKRMVNDVITIKDPIYVQIEMTGAVTVLSSYVNAVVEAAVDAALDAFFDLSNIDFGGDLYLSDFYRLIDEIEGVDHLELSKFTRVPDPIYVIWSGDATIGTVTISATTIAETWEIILTSATTFTVEGSISGVQVNTGTFGVAYTSDDNEIAFTVTTGGTPCQTSDKATFKTSLFVGSVIVDYEFPTQGPINLTYSGGQ